jgi:glycosyltransferase involved in cell wall biosynthesis
MTDLATFERAAYGRALNRVDLLAEILLDLATGKIVPAAVAGAAIPDAQLSRLASAIAAILADPDVVISQAQYDRMSFVVNDLRRLFQATGFEGTDFLLRALSEGGISTALLASRLPLLSLDSELAWPPEFLASLPPSAAQQVLASLISTKPVTSARAQARRDQLLDYGPSLPPADFPCTPKHLVLITSAWMLCSYAGTPDKHGIKRLFNETLKGMARVWGFKNLPMPAVRELKPRPRILFAAEIMHSKHVQYRYFGQYLRQLRDRFELVLLTEDKEADDQVRTLFDSVLTFDRSAPEYLARIYHMFAETAPDIIFYPSVGMRHWGPLFANLRLAPIQLTALGHSASTFCDTIDYYLLEEGYVSDPRLFGETVLTVPDESLVFERMPGFAPPPPQLRRTPTPLRIALPSNALKLNPGFIALLARIRGATRRRLEFHFLPNAVGLELAALNRAIQRAIPGAIVHGTASYDRYMQIITACDINLSPFPFGGLHSVIDSLRQGLPVVAMDCPEPHGRTDAMLLRRLGMPEWLIAKDEEEYVAAALRLIDDDALRVSLSERALSLDVGNVMFGDAATPLRHEIGDTLWWLYQNHEAAKADGRKLWSLADRAAFPAI